MTVPARPRCLHWWVSHGVPTEDDYGCSIPVSSMDERERGIFEVCGCTFAEGNPVTPRQVRIWTDGTSWPLAPWQRRPRALAPRPDRRRRLPTLPRLRGGLGVGWLSVNSTIWRKNGPMSERKYRKTVAEAERELAKRPPLPPAEDAMLHGEMTLDHIAVAQATMARARALLEAVQSKRAQSDPQHPGPSTA